MNEEPGSEVLFYIDAEDEKQSNVTGRINCGLTDANNNFEILQEYDRLYYVATRDIDPGCELYIDYGPEYREHNLGMKGPY